MSGCVASGTPESASCSADVAHDVCGLDAVERIARAKIGERALRSAVAQRARDAVAQHVDLARQRARNPLEMRAPLRHRGATRVRLDAQPARADLFDTQRAPFEQEDVADAQARREALVE